MYRTIVRFNKLKLYFVHSHRRNDICQNLSSYYYHNIIGTHTRNKKEQRMHDIILAHDNYPFRLNKPSCKKLFGKGLTGKIIKVCPGGKHVWIDTPWGLKRKQITQQQLKKHCAQQKL